MSEIKKLYRPVDGARLAGVCEGLGHYFRVDPVVIRLIWILVTLTTGVIPGLVAYLIAWILVPQQPLPARATRPMEPTPGEAPQAHT